MKENTTMVLPKQPFFVLATNKYYKVMVLNYGISHFYTFETNEGTADIALAIPDGCVDILFCCDKENSWAHICGTVLRPQQVFHRGKCTFFGVRFLPGVLPKLCNVNMAELLEQEVSLEDVILDKGLIERIVECEDFSMQQRIFMDTYLKYYPKGETFASKEYLNRYLMDEIVHKAGNITVAQLAQDTAYSERYINRVFKENYGMVPKLYCKLMRFQYLLDCMNLKDESIDFAALSLDTGFYDQSHMIKNFKDFTQITPQKYVLLMKEAQFTERLIVLD